MALSVEYPKRAAARLWLKKYATEPQIAFIH